MADGGPSRSGEPDRLDVEVMRRSELWDRTGAMTGALSLAALAALDARAAVAAARPIRSRSS